MFGIAIIAGAAACSTTTSSHTVPGPTVTKQVPAPTVTQTQTEAPPPPAAGTTIATLTGMGNAATKSFNVPDSGNFVVQWTYSGNIDNSFGDSTPDNFTIMDNGDGFGNLPNDIAASGHGSTEVTGDTGTTDSFNVEANAACSWTITIVSAS